MTHPKQFAHCHPYIHAAIGNQPVILSPPTTHRQSQFFAVRPGSSAKVWELQTFADQGGRQMIMFGTSNICRPEWSATIWSFKHLPTRVVGKCLVLRQMFEVPNICRPGWSANVWNFKRLPTRVVGKCLGFQTFADQCGRQRFGTSNFCRPGWSANVWFGACSANAWSQTVANKDGLQMFEAMPMHGQYSKYAADDRIAFSSEFGFQSG